MVNRCERERKARQPDTPRELRHQLEVIDAYWMTCQVPEVDTTERQLRTNSEGKLGERFPQLGVMTN